MHTGYHTPKHFHREKLKLMLKDYLLHILPVVIVLMAYDILHATTFHARLLFFNIKRYCDAGLLYWFG